MLIEQIICHNEDSIDTELNYDDKNIISCKIKIITLYDLHISSKSLECNFIFECEYDNNLSGIDFTIENCISQSKELIYENFNQDNNIMNRVWNYQATIQIINDLKYIPHNNIYFLIRMILKKSYYQKSNENIYIKSISEINDNYTDSLVENYIFSNQLDNSITYVWNYETESTEYIAKYFAIPTLLTFLQQIPQTVQNGNSGTSATTILSDIALLYTIPETNTLILSEKIVYLNLIFKIVLGLFDYYDIGDYLRLTYFSSWGTIALDFIISFSIIIITIFYALYLFSTAIENNNKIKYLFHNCNFNINRIKWDLDSFVKYNKSELINYKSKHFSNTKTICKKFGNMERIKKIFILFVIIFYTLFTTYAFKFINKK